MTVKKSTTNRLFSTRNFFTPILISHPNEWVKIGVILSIQLASIYFGMNASREWAVRVAVLVGGVIGFIFLLRRPEVGIILLIPMSFFAPWEVTTGTSIPINMAFLFSIALVVIWIFKVIVSRTTIYPRLSSIIKYCILFIVATCVSLVGGNIFWVTEAHSQASIQAQIGGWFLYVIPIGIMLYIQANLKEIRWIKITTWLFIGLGSIYIFELISPIKFSRYIPFVARSTESMYWTWLAALVFAQFLFNKDLQKHYRIALALLPIAIVATGLSGNRFEWKSGWLPPLIAIGTILWLRSWRLGLSATLITIAYLIIAKSSNISDVLTVSEQYSLNSRAATYPIMFELIKANPITGLGFANYSYYTSLYPIWGWYVSFNSHSNYMDMIAQMGFIGLILFIGLMAAIGLRGWKLRRNKLDGFSSGFINGCLGGLVGMIAAGFLGDWFLPYLYNIGIPGFRSSIFAWIFIGGLLALGRIIQQEKSSKEYLSTPEYTYDRSRHY